MAYCCLEWRRINKNLVLLINLSCRYESSSSYASKIFTAANKKFLIALKPIQLIVRPDEGLIKLLGYPIAKLQLCGYCWRLFDSLVSHTATRLFISFWKPGGLGWLWMPSKTYNYGLTQQIFKGNSDLVG